MTDNLVERLRAEAAVFVGNALQAACGFDAEMDDVTGQLLDEAASELSRLQEALAAAETERDEARGWAKEWHRVCQTIATIMELPEPEANFAEVVRAAIPALLAETRKKALEEAAGIEVSFPRELGPAMLDSPFKAVERYRAAIRSISNEDAPK